MSAFPPVLVGPRLTLRGWEVDDAEALDAAIAASLDHLRPWMAWVKFEPLGLAARREKIESWNAEARDDGDDMPYGMFVDGVVVGGCGLHHRGEPDTLDIGYWVHVDHIRKGYAADAARLLTDAAFTIPGIERVAIHHDRANVASRGVPASLGFHLDGERPDEASAPAEVGVDVCWSITADGWDADSR